MTTMEVPPPAANQTEPVAAPQVTTPVAAAPATPVEAPVAAPITESLLAKPAPDAVAQATETKAADEKPKARNAPEQYDLKTTNGEVFDSGVLSAFTSVAKELDLSNESAQKVLDKVAPALEARTNQQIQGMWSQFASETKADKEIGGDKLPETLANAHKALDALASPELRKLLVESPIGSHREMLRFLAKAGKAISADSFVNGANKAPEQDLAKRMYPYMA